MSVATNDTHTQTRAKIFFSVFPKSIYFIFGGENKFTESLMINKPPDISMLSLILKEYEVE